jgi:hypothetical protein
VKFAGAKVSVAAGEVVEVPPLEPAGLVTVTATAPGAVILNPRRSMRSLPVERKRVGNAVPFKFTVEPDTKFVPSTETVAL